MRTHERVKDSRGWPVVGIYKRGARLVAGASVHGRWQLRTLEATTLTEARRERESWLSGLREGRIAERNGTTFEAMFEAWQEGPRFPSGRGRTSGISSIVTSGSS